MSTKLPIDKLMRALRQNTLVKIFEEFEKTYPDDLLKDLVVDEIGAGRDIVVMGRRVTNFGSDSFLGLDQDPRVIQAIHRGLDRWGSHNGTSRAFSSVRSNLEAEEKLAAWLGVESTLIYPSVTLANHGAIPGLVGRKDVVVMDELAHNSIQEGARLAQAGGARVATFAHNSPEDLERTLQKVKPYRLALICIDGVYSMSGAIPPMKAFNEIAISRDGVLYIDDAHGTGVLGERGRGTVLEALGSYDNAFVVGSLSKAFSCAGGFIACSRAVSEAAQDALEYLYLWWAGRPGLPRRDLRGRRYPSVRRVPAASRASRSPCRAAVSRTGGARSRRERRDDADPLGLGRRRGRYAEGRQSSSLTRVSMSSRSCSRPFPTTGASSGCSAMPITPTPRSTG